MAFTPFVETDLPSMANYNAKFLECISESVASSLRIESGSYMGTGTGGSESNPISMVFGGKPIIVFIANFLPSKTPSTWFFPILYDDAFSTYRCWQEYSSTSPWSINTYVSVRLDGTTLNWYATGSERSMNASGVTYYYFAVVE